MAETELKKGKHSMKTILEKVKKWFASVHSEIPAFCELCRTTTRLVVKTTKKRDTAIEKSAIKELRTKSKNAQIAFGGILLTVLAICFLRGCGDSKQPSSSHWVKNGNVKIQEGKSLTAEEAFARMVDSRLHQLAFVRGRPMEGEIWYNEIPIVTVFQVVEGGILVETERSSLSPEAGTRIFFVRTSRRYADGDKLATGFYRCIGMFSYMTTGGAKKTVHAFEELSQSLQIEIGKMVTKKQRESIEENIRQQNLAQEAQKHPTTAANWLKSVSRGIGKDVSDGCSPLLAHLKSKSYVYGIFRKQCEKELAKKLESIVGNKTNERSRLIVEAFAEWVFKEKIDTTKALLDRYMPTFKFNMLEKNLVVQKSLRDNVEIRYDKKIHFKAMEMQQKKDWLGLLNLGFDTEYKITEIKDDAAYWMTYDILMQKLSTYSLEVYIYPTGNAKPKFVRDMVDVEEFQIRTSGYGVDVLKCRDIPLNGENAFPMCVRESTKESDAAVKKLSEEFKSRKVKIVSEYRLPIDTEDEKAMKHRIEALKDEFCASYRRWIEEN